MAESSVLAVAAIVAAGAALQASVGVGFAVLAAPIVAILAPELVPGPMLVLGLLLASLTTTRDFRSVDTRDLGLAMAGRIPGTVAAGAVIALLPMSVFSAIFALMILAAVGLSVSRWHLLPTPRNLVAAGLLSGFMGTITSVGSPPIGLVYQNMPGPKVRATLSAYFMLGAGVSLLTLAMVGRFTVAQVTSCAWLVPSVVLGFVVARRFARSVDSSKAVLKLAVLGVSTLAALTLLLKPLF